MGKYEGNAGKKRTTRDNDGGALEYQIQRCNPGKREHLHPASIQVLHTRVGRAGALAGISPSLRVSAAPPRALGWSQAVYIWVSLAGVRRWAPKARATPRRLVG